MADKKESSPKMSPDRGEESIDEKIGSYDQLLKRLEQERDKVEQVLREDYRNARRYVRSHPEEGVLFSFAGGMILGLILGKLTN